MSTRFSFQFGAFSSTVLLQRQMPTLSDIGTLTTASRMLVVCDENTKFLSDRMIGSDASVPLVVLPAGEEAKGWDSVEKILKGAYDAHLSRDGLFIGVGGGVIGDLVAFAASIYMRGAPVVLVPTTLLSMVDASVGGKTGFDLFGIKNLAGTFRPADAVCMPIEALATLSPKEWKSGLAEVIKTALIGDEALLSLLETSASNEAVEYREELVSRCIAVKGRIVERDPRETGTERALLNLGHTFGHALEAVTGLGNLSHGEAVAWGIAQATRLASALHRIGAGRETRIMDLLMANGYETGRIHPAALASAGGDRKEAVRRMIEAMGTDKKKKNGELRFVIPLETGCELVSGIQTIFIEALLLGGSL